MKKVVFASICFAPILFSAACHAQATRLPDDTNLIYVGKKGFFSAKVDYTRSTSADGLDGYQGRSLFRFDPKSFAWIAITKSGGGLDHKITMNASVSAYTVGASWKGTYESPATAAAKCSDNTQHTYRASVNAVHPVAVKIGDGMVEVEAIKVLVDGTWSSCGFEGTSSRTTTYAPSLGILLESEAA